MSKRPSRGVSSGVGSPMRMSGRDGDLTIRKTKEGKILYVKEHGKWHPINTGVDVAQMKKDVDRLIRSVDTLRNDNNPYPIINALNIRKNLATATVDPKITFTIAGTDKYSIGVDDSSAADDFVISASGAIGSLDRFVMTSGGDIDTTGDMDIGVSKAYSINGTSFLNLTTLGSGVVNSSLTSVGTLTTLTAGKTILTPSITDSIGAQSRIAGLEINPTLDYGDTHSGTNTYAGIQYTQTETDVAGFDGGVNYMDMRSVYTVGSASYSGGTTITHASSSAIRKNDLVSGTDIPAEAYVSSITDVTHFELSASTSGSQSGQTLTFTSSRLKVKNDFGGTKGSAYGTAADTKYLMIKEDTGELQYRTAGDIKSDSATASFTGTFSEMTVDTDTSGNSAEDKTSLHVDLDRTVATSGTAAHNDIGINLDVNSASLGTSSAIAMDIDIVGATTGTHSSTGIDITVSASDNNNGLVITAPDGATDSHIKLVAPDDADDFATFKLANTGDLTIATIGDGSLDSDLILDADGDIELNADAGTVHFKDALVSLFKVVQGRGDLFYNNTNYLKTTVSSAGVAVISTVGGTAADADFTIDSGGDITLDSGTGLFIAKKAGTEFSAANSAYAGMILGYTYIQPNALTSHALQTSFTVEDAGHKVAFTYPPSGNVEIFVEGYFDRSSTSDVTVSVGLSDGSSYNRFGPSTEHSFSAVSNSDDEADDGIYSCRFMLTGGSGAEEVWIGLKSSDTIAVNLRYGYITSPSDRAYAPFVIKATALPATVYDGT